MRKHVIRIGFAAAFALGQLGLVAAAGAAPNLPNYQPIDISAEVRGWDATLDHINTSSLPQSEEELQAGEEAAMEAAAATPIDECTTDAKYWLYLDDYNGFYDFTTFYQVAQTDQSELWVQTDLSWPEGDPRATPAITCEQAASLLDAFDNTMYPQEIDFFGPPDSHDGTATTLDTDLGLPDGYWTNEDGRQVVLVENVRDENYYDPTYPNYIAGFYSSAFDDYFDRNVMTIDGYDWDHRTGPNPPDDDPDHPPHPYLYEGVFSHEYQHLLHADYDPDEENFINEGLSDFAEFLVGYGVANQSHLEAAASNPENSLTVWGDQGGLEILTDYGQAALFQLYMYEQFGEQFTRDLFHEPANGISGVNNTLAAHHIHRTFADVYHDFSVAMLIDSNKAGGKYKFDEVDFNVDMGTPDAPNPEAYDTPGAPPWGTDYLWIDSYLEDHDVDEVRGFKFNGLDYTTYPTSWTSDDSDGDPVLFSGAGDLLDNWAIFEAPGGGTLSFDTYFDIETSWDFGFVQVSTDGGNTWTSLANDDTTDEHVPNAYPTVIENVPGFTGWSGDLPGADEDGWVNESFDLSAYAGQDVLLAFRYVTDWSFTAPGWWVDNVMVDGDLISDGSDASVFQDITEVVPINNDFNVTFVGFKSFGNGNPFKVSSFRLDSMTEDGVTSIRRLLKEHTDVAMLVTSDAAEGFTGYADYTFGFLFKEDGGRHGKGNNQHGRFHGGSWFRRSRRGGGRGGSNGPWNGGGGRRGPGWGHGWYHGNGRGFGGGFGF